MRAVLLFLIGVLVGANAVYFAMTRWSSRALPPRECPTLAMRACPTGPADRPAAPAGAAKSTLPRSSTAPVDTRTSPANAATLPAPVQASDILAMPLPGVSAAQLRDTFNETRGGTRRHEALDIMAAAGTPVLAVADGHVQKLFTSDAGGLTIYQFEPTGRYAYYYAHLQGYAPNLREGQQVTRGQLLGYVGSTGNADPAAPHLHFAVFALGPEKQWWKGTPLNPYPLLGGVAPPTGSTLAERR